MPISSSNIHDNLCLMPKPLIGAIYLLNSKPDNSLAVITGFGEQMEFCQRGVADLWHLLNSSPELLKGAFVADKVVGKAAAALMITGGAAGIYAQTISELALDLLSATTIPVYYSMLTPHIINRTRSGWCPLETRCRDCRTARECIEQIDEFMTQQKQ